MTTTCRLSSPDSTSVTTYSMTNGSPGMQHARPPDVPLIPGTRLAASTWCVSDLFVFSFDLRAWAC